VIYLLNELESVEYVRQSVLTSFLSTVSLDSRKQRQFMFALVGRQCNSTWTIFKKLYLTNSSIEHVDTETNLCRYINYPTNDSTTEEDGGWRTLRIVLFVLLGVTIACTAALVAFFVIRLVE